jgi:hypothetical protein
MKTLLRTPRGLRLMLIILLAGLLMVCGEGLGKAHAASLVTVTRCPTESTLLATISTAGAGGIVRFSISRPCRIFIHSTLVISQDLTLDNQGQPVTLDAGRLGRVLLVQPHVSFTLNALTIANGKASNGGGLLASATSTVHISHSTFSHNDAQFGGGLLAESGSLLGISHSSFAYDSAQFGGGLLAESGSIVRISYSSFTHDSAQFGGGLLAESGSIVRISHSTFADNSGTSQGSSFFNRAS